MFPLETHRAISSHRGIKNDYNVEWKDEQETKKMKLAICGPGKCGKDTVAIYLNGNTILRYAHSTSWMAVGEVMFEMARRPVEPIKYNSNYECYNDRSNHRAFWSDVIDKINQNDPAALYRKHVQYQDILAGIRKLRELQACLDTSLIHLTIWIQKDDVPPDETIDYGPDDCDVIISNNRGIAELEEKLDNFSRILGIHKDDFSQTRWRATGRQS